MFSRLITSACLATLGLSASAQQAPQAMGTVHTADATITGGLEVSGQRALLLTNASVTAAGQNAPIDLTRGGQVLVCSTSQFHLLRSSNAESLVFALDRGAIEIHGKSQPQDVIQTADLRFTLVASGDFDFRLRVTSNGDTCVENAGVSSPPLTVSDVFSDITYRLQPGQHVLFEHGDLHQVVDQERSACGCPAATSAPPPVIVAQRVGGSTSAAQAATQNPFPAAVSQGLAPETKPANNAGTPAGETHTQVTGVITYGDTETVGSVASATPTPAKPVSNEPPPSPPGAHDIAHAIGRFFHRLFHPKD